MRNNKAFTMIELLGVIVILALVIAIAVPAISKQLGGFKGDYYDSLEKNVLIAAEDYFSDKRFSKPTEVLHTSYVDVSYLSENGYLNEKVVDQNGDSCDGSYILAIKTGEADYEYAVCLVCENDNYSTKNSDKYKEEINERENNGQYVKDYCNDVWKDNTDTYLKSQYEIENTPDDSGRVVVEGEIGNLENPKLVTVSFNVSKTAIEEKVGMIYVNEKKDKDGKVLFKASDSNDYIYPKNLSVLANKTSELKEVKLEYEVSDGKFVYVDAQVSPIPVKILVAIKYAQAAPGLGKNIDSDYSEGDKAGKLKFNLSISDNVTYDIDGYEYSLDEGSTWKHACDVDSSDSCSFIFEENFAGKIMFRTVVRPGNYMIKSNSYDVMVVRSTPICTIELKSNGDKVNGGETLTIFTDKKAHFKVDGSGVHEKKVVVKKADNTEIYKSNNSDSSGLDIGTYEIIPECIDDLGNVGRGESATLIIKDKVIYITFASNGGSGTMEKQACSYNKNCKISKNTFTKPGYSFKNWSSSDGNTYTDEKNVKFTGDTVLTANWTGNTYKVKFNGNGKTSGSTGEVTCTYGSDCTLTANGFKKTGYKFSGWATSADGSKVYDDKEKVKNLASSGTVTLYAKWSPNTYKVQYNGNGSTGGSTSETSCTYDSDCTLMANGFKKTGYKFDGWATRADGNVVYSNKEKVKNLATSGTVTLYAKWSISYKYYYFASYGGYCWTFADRYMGGGSNYANGDLYVCKTNDNSNCTKATVYSCNLIGTTDSNYKYFRVPEGKYNVS